MYHAKHTKQTRTLTKWRFTVHPLFVMLAQHNNSSCLLGVNPSCLLGLCNEKMLAQYCKPYYIIIPFNSSILAFGHFIANIYSR